jgi:flagellar hook-length control protein FliK
MSEVTSLSPTATAARVPAGTSATLGAGDASAAEASFSELLEAGMEKLAVGDAKSAAKLTPGVADKDVHELPAADPAAVLSQIMPAVAPQSLPVPGLIPPFTPAGQSAAQGAHNTEMPAKLSAPRNELSRVAPDAAPDQERRTRNDEPQAAETFRMPPPDFAAPAAVTAEHMDKHTSELHAKASQAQAPETPLQGLASSHRPTEAATARIEPIPQPVGTPAWDDALSGRVVWMTKNDVQSAEIRLNPEDLGPIEVRLSLSGDQNSTATVQFTATQGATRDAIEAALPRLREMLEASGISLGNASVDAGNAGQAGNPGEFTRAARGQSGSRVEGPPDAAGELRISRPARRGNGLVDTFA